MFARSQGARRILRANTVRPYGKDVALININFVNKNGVIFEFEKQGIKLVINGALEIQTLDINKFLIDPEDKETLQDLVMLTMNQAIEEILKKKKEINDSFTKGMF